MSIPARLPTLALLAALAACARTPVDAPPKSVVFFTPFSADLDSGAKAAIDEFAHDAQTNPTRSVLVEGYADRVGTPASNRTLSELRAQVVADALAQRGIDRRRITLRPRGPTDTEPGLESRRVELELGR